MTPQHTVMQYRQEGCTLQCHIAGQKELNMSRERVAAMGRGWGSKGPPEVGVGRLARGQGHVHLELDDDPTRPVGCSQHKDR